jgi:hypothetical protein
MVTPPSELSAERCSLECAVTSYATSRFTFEAVNALRKQSDTLPGALGNSVLRHSDEQTLAALVAVRDAVTQFETPPENYHQWGVVFSTRYLGRSAFAQALNKFAVDGPWNVSVQVVPNRSLHSPASMVGLALGCHGPCVGVGGGLDGETDAWLTATSLLEQQSLPGIWLVFGGWEPDKRIDIEGTPIGETRCTALALALQPAAVDAGSARLRIIYDPQAPTELEIPATATAMSLFEDFVAAQESGRALTTLLGGGLRVEMEWADAERNTIPLPGPTPSSQQQAA